MTQMLYRASDTPNEAVWNRKVEHRAFDEDDVADQLENGWFAHPDDIPEEAEDDQSDLLAPVKRGPGRPRKTEGEG